MQPIVTTLKSHQHGGNQAIQKALSPGENVDLPRELILKIFSYLNALELEGCLGVCREWRFCASDEGLWKKLPRPSQAFGRQEWLEYFGDCGEEPPLPRGIHRLLISPCPFIPGRRVGETHLLVLVPQKIEGRLLTFASLNNQLMQKRKSSSYCFDMRYLTDAQAEDQALTFPSHWVLMINQVIPGSCHKNYAHQKAMLDQLNKQAGVHYVVPSLLEAAACVLTHYVKNLDWLFESRQLRCQEKSSWWKSLLFSEEHVLLSVSILEGLCVYRGDHPDCQEIGLAALRRFT